MEEIIIFTSIVTFIAIVLEMYRISKLVKSQEKMIILQNELIQEHKKTYLLDQEIIKTHEELNIINDKIIANLKK